MIAASKTEIRLGGPLGRMYGRQHSAVLDPNTPAEALRWLFSQLPGSRRYFAQAHERGIEFAIFRGKGATLENIGMDQLREPAGGAICIMPVIEGAKSGEVLQTIVGVVLVIVDFVASGKGNEDDKLTLQVLRSKWDSIASEVTKVKNVASFLMLTYKGVELIANHIHTPG